MEGKDTMKTAVWMPAILLLVATVGIVQAAAEKSPMVLFQEALYQEETEGDLDKAIELYQQVLNEAAEVERIAARTTYQLGMCHLKKGDKDKAAEYFQEVVSYYPEQASVVKKAQKQLQKVSSVDDIIAQSYVIHYKTVNTSEDGLTVFNQKHPKGVKTHHANRYKQNGQQISSICTNTKEDADKIVEMLKQHDKLELVKVQEPKIKSDGLYEQAPDGVWSTISVMYGQVCAKAGMKQLYTNGIIHLVNSDFTHWSGGYGYHMNTSDEVQDGRICIVGTTNPNQKHYDVMGNPLDTEITSDEEPEREKYFKVYLNLPRPLVPGQFYPYAWEMEGAKQLQKAPFSSDGKHNLRMQNHLGNHGFEVFYLVVPDNVEIAEQGEKYTNKQVFGDYTIYAWEKEVQPDENHAVTVYLSKKRAFPEYKPLHQPINVNVNENPESDTLSVQYAVIAITEAAGISYRWDKSAKLADPQRRQFVKPLNVNGKTTAQALDELLGPVGLKYDIDAEGLYLYNPEKYQPPQTTRPDAHQWVEDFFKHNYRDITKRKTLEWGEPTTDEKGNISIRYKYEATIWDKDKIINDQIFTFNKDGKYVSAKSIIDPSNVDSIRQLVEKFFNNNYRDITRRKTLEWGEMVTHDNGNVSIRYKYEATIWDKDKKINNQIFTFDKDGKFISVKDVNAVSNQTKAKDTDTPRATIMGFMQAAFEFDIDKVMSYVASDSHDYDDIKEIFETPDHPFYTLFKKADASLPVKVTKTDISDTMCSAVWEFTLKEDFDLEGKLKLKAGDTFELDGNLHQYGDKWLITGI